MYLVVGANGFLGTYIIKNILEKTNDDITATARDIAGLENTQRLTWVKCDISDSAGFDGLVEKVKAQSEPVKVIILAACHHPDVVASDPEFAWDINVTSLSRCVNKLRFAKKLFYASTDTVYGNSEDGYAFKEDDRTSPVNEYGRHKCAAEAVIRYAGFNVVRFPFLIGASLAKHKKHFYDNICSELERGNKVEMFCDSYRSSLNFDTAASLLIELCEHEGEAPAVMNICGDEALSKYDIGLMIADKLGVERDRIVPVKMSESDIFATPRALSTLMDNRLLKSFLKLDRVDFIL